MRMQGVDHNVWQFVPDKSLALAPLQHEMKFGHVSSQMISTGVALKVIPTAVSPTNRIILGFFEIISHNHNR